MTIFSLFSSTSAMVLLATAWVLPPAADTWQGQAGTNSTRKSGFILLHQLLSHNTQIQKPTEKKARSLSISFVSVELTSVVISQCLSSIYLDPKAWAWSLAAATEQLQPRCAGLESLTPRNQCRGAMSFGAGRAHSEQGQNVLSMASTS